jgi:LEA14-like dessication related protein
MRNLIAVIVLGMLIATCGGCGMLGQPTASIKGVRLTDIGLQSATLTFDVEVTNPYAVGLPLANLDYALASRGQSFLSGKAQMQGSVPANSAKTISLPAKVVYLELMKALTDVKPGAVVPYTAEMGLSVDAPAVGTLRLPMKKSGELPVPACPQVSAPSIKWDTADLDHVGGTVSIAMVNPNSFAVDLTKMHYALSLAGVEVAAGDVAKPIKFAASGGSGTIQVPVSFSPRQMGMAAYSIISGGKADYKLGGTLELASPFGPIALPLDTAGKTSISR